MSRARHFLILVLWIVLALDASVASGDACAELFTPQSIKVSQGGLVSLQSMVDEFILPILGDRAEFAKIEIMSGAVSVVSPAGRYVFRTDKGIENRPPRIKVSTRGNVYYVSADVAVNLNAPFAHGRIRSTMRADRWLHPLMSPDEIWEKRHKIKLAPYQQEVVDGLISFESNPKFPVPTQGPLIVGQQMPGGSGKSVTAMEWIRRLTAEKYNGIKPKIIYLVENVEALEQASKKFRERLEINKVVNVFGRNTGQTIPADFDAVFITRTGYIQRKSSFENAFSREASNGANSRPFVVVMDEAHHTGRQDGEFDQIFEHLHRQLSTRDRVLLSAAGMWHGENQNLVQSRMQGRIVGAFLAESELEDLQNGRNLERIARLQLYRAILEGYLSPIEDAMTRIDESLSNEMLPIRGESATVSLPLYSDLVNHIQGSRNGVADRGLIFESTRQRANFVAQLLQRQGLGKVLPVHSEVPQSVLDENINLFSSSPQTLPQHLYITGVESSREGLDFPAINMIAIMHRSQRIHRLLSMLARGLRVAPFKTGLRVIDYSGMLPSLFADLTLRDAVMPPRSGRVHDSARPNASEVSGVSAKMSGVPESASATLVHFDSVQAMMDALKAPPTEPQVKPSPQTSHLAASMVPPDQDGLKLLNELKEELDSRAKLFLEDQLRGGLVAADNFERGIGGWGQIQHVIKTGFYFNGSHYNLPQVKHVEHDSSLDGALIGIDQMLEQAARSEGFDPQEYYDYQLRPGNYILALEYIAKIIVNKCRVLSESPGLAKGMPVPNIDTNSLHLWWELEKLFLIVEPIDHIPIIARREDLWRQVFSRQAELVREAARRWLSKVQRLGLTLDEIFTQPVFMKEIEELETPASELRSAYIIGLKLNIHRLAMMQIRPAPRYDVKAVAAQHAYFSDVEGISVLMRVALEPNLEKAKAEFDRIMAITLNHHQTALGEIAREKKRRR